MITSAIHQWTRFSVLTDRALWSLSAVAPRLVACFWSIYLNKFIWIKFIVLRTHLFPILSSAWSSGRQKFFKLFQLQSPTVSPTVSYPDVTENLQSFFKDPLDTSVESSKIHSNCKDFLCLRKFKHPVSTESPRKKDLKTKGRESLIVDLYFFTQFYTTDPDLTKI